MINEKKNGKRNLTIDNTESKSSPNPIVEGFYLSEKGFKSLDEIKQLKHVLHPEKIKSISLSYNNINDVEGLANFPNLEDLSLSANKITEVKGLNYLKNLKSLAISHNQIEKIDLSNLVKLEQLHLSNNNLTSVSDIEGLENLKSLKWLDLSSNNITDMRGLGELESLEHLDLRENPIEELHDLHRLTHLKDLGIHLDKMKDPQERNALREEVPWIRNIGFFQYLCEKKSTPDWIIFEIEHWTREDINRRTVNWSGDDWTGSLWNAGPGYRRFSGDLKKYKDLIGRHYPYILERIQDVHDENRLKKRFLRFLETELQVHLEDGNNTSILL